MMIHAPRCASAMILAAAAALVALPATAADPATSQPERAAACDGAHQDRAACLREAGAAKQERASGGLTSPPPAAEQQNALERCAAQPPAERAECEARISGTGKSSVEGSVEEGAILRKTETPVPAARQ